MVFIGMDILGGSLNRFEREVICGCDLLRVEPLVFHIAYQGLRSQIGSADKKLAIAGAGPLGKIAVRLEDRKWHLQSPVGAICRTRVNSTARANRFQSRRAKWSNVTMP
jgi:hypothetical protein